MKFWMMFALSAALFWGAYVPTIFYGQTAFGAPKNPNAAMRAFLFIGLAYFVMAVLVPGLWLYTHPLEKTVDAGFNWTGSILSTLAGVLGAAGALCVVFSLRNAKMEGVPIDYVAPVVFAGAPVINVLISWLIKYLQGEGHAPNFMFVIGVIVSIVGVSLVLLNNPAGHGPAKTPASSSLAPSSSKAH